MADYEDKELKCIDCQALFILTAGEQEFYATTMTKEGTPFKPPKRCVPCRKKKSAQMRESQVPKP